MNQFERRKHKYPKDRAEPEEGKKINVNRGKVRVSYDFEPREQPVETTHKGSNGDDFLTEGLE